MKFKFEILKVIKVRSLQIYIYINRESLEKFQLEFEIIIPCYIMCLNLYGDYTIIIHLNFLIYVPSD